MISMFYYELGEVDMVLQETWYETGYPEIEWSEWLMNNYGIVYNNSSYQFTDEAQYHHFLLVAS